MEIIGAKGKITNVEDFLQTIKNYSKKRNITIQVFNAEMIYGKKHLISAVKHAKRAFERKKNTTNSLGMETLLYASGERQLKQAIPKMGIKKNNTKIALVFLQNTEKNKIPKKTIDNLLKKLSLTQEDKVLEGNIETLKKFGITQKEIETVTEERYQDLVLEKIALVDIIK